MRLVRRSVPSAARVIVCALLYFLLRAQPWAAPQAGRIDTINPNAGRAGDVITITGIGFGGQNVVIRVGGIPATVIESTGTRVRFRVPNGLPPGPTTVTATNPGGHTGSIAFQMSGGRAPTANAGPDQTVHVSDVAQLNGAASTDPDGDSLTYQWSLTSFPPGSSAPLTLSSATAISPTFVVDLPGTYIARLIVNDGTANSAPDTVRIDTLNSPPLANAGLDQTVHVGTMVTLDGNLSLDVDGNPITYAWAFKTVPAGGPPPQIVSAQSANPVFLVDRPGTFEVELVVSDGQANSAPDVVSISTVNSAPLANAGADQFVAAGDGVVLDGSGSFDVDLDQLSYQWSMVSRPAGSAAAFDPTNATAELPMFMTDVGGLYVVQLVVFDGSLESAGSDLSTVTISANGAPVVTASAAPDSVLLSAGAPAPTVQLTGTVVDDGLPAPPSITTAWTFAGPGAVTLSDASSTAPTATFASPGPYTFTLSASDGQLTGSASVTVSVIEDACAIDNGSCDPRVQCLNTANGPVCGECPAGFAGDGVTCVDINECEVNNGGCAVGPDGTPLSQCTNTDGSRSCAPCPAGYTGNGLTCTDIDECKINNGGCDPLMTCTNTPGSRSCSSCPVGYRDENGQCVDIDECKVANGGCDPLSQCTNTAGSRTCGNCPSGYRDEIGQCIDINECQDNNGGCDPLMTCTNTPGSRSCSACPVGYRDENGQCVDIDECKVANGGCDPLMTCTNTPGSRSCSSCPVGYRDENGQCVDIDECKVANGGCDPRTQCTNTAGSRSCGICPPGYTGDGITGCTDVNECLEDNGGCDPLTQCTNTSGSRVCGNCPAGYTFNGQACIDINECLTPGRCSSLKECINTPGAYECSDCPSGYNDVNGQCIDINECQDNNGDCDPKTACINTAGSRQCGPCPPGYNGDGVNGCSDVNECDTNNGGCDPLRQCINTPGSRTCGSCPLGYILGANGQCVDFNECQVANGGCDPKTACINTAGSRQCGPCPPGYTGTGLTGCTDVNECDQNNGGCDPLRTCTNTAGSRTCGSCQVGYLLGANGQCVDVNECAFANGGCDPKTTCVNTVGSRSCGDCPAGYAGDGVTGCTDINECQVNNGGCDTQTTCFNTAGSRQCGPCPPGYNGNGVTGCADINECNINHGGCDPLQACINTAGSRVCGQCPEGYVQQGGQCVPGFAANEHSAPDPADLGEEYLAVLPTAQRLRHSVRRGRRA